MKRIICIMLIFTLLFFCVGCNQTTNNSANTVSFYYMQNDFPYGSKSAVITPVTVKVNWNTDDYQSLIDMYLRGPTSYDCISPFPAGIYLESFQMDNNKVQLILSPHMATLSDSSFTIACACLTQTVIEMTGVKALQLKIHSKQINGADSLLLTLNDFTYWDDVAVDGHS